MTGFETYQLCHSLKLHFNESNYDFFVYNGKTNVTMKGYLKRKENKYIYESLCSKYSDDELKEYFVSNIVSGDKHAGVYGDMGNERYHNWKKNIQSMTYNFTIQVKFLVDCVDNFDELFKVVGGKNPILLQAYYHGDVSIETFLIMNQILDFFPQFSHELGDIYRWPNEERICLQYIKFLDIDIHKYTTILKNTLNIR
tara:strand:+ start:464 stop:1057 length:594 start_codon:yes stop_codon:yes gene_type:complete